MDLEAALRQIGEQSGSRVLFDPDAVRGKVSEPVINAKNARAAIAQAIEHAGLTMIIDPSGAIMISNDILVVARRDEAETRVLVDQASTSDRNGASLREQARNNQVISAKLIADQQALTINEALRNAGGIVSSGPSTSSGSSYFVRGFSAAGLVNGLSGASSYGVAAGSSQPIANVERVEVLKGPDAILSGFENLGGNVNVVTKRPSADPFLIGTFDTGSYGLVRGSLDANTALTDNGKLSARIVASGERADRNYGGYAGNKGSLFAPTIRYKDGRTDILFGLSAVNSISGITPFRAYNRLTGKLFNTDPYSPIYSSDQQVRVVNTRYYFDASHKFSDGFSIVARGMKEKTRLDLDLYPITVSSRTNLAQVSIRGSAQTGNSNALDVFARMQSHVGGVHVKVNAGFNYSDGDFSPLSGSTSVTERYDFEAIPMLSTPRPEATVSSFTLGTRQYGAYGQMLVEVWKLKLLGSFRQNWYKQDYSSEFFSSTINNKAGVPSFGAILDLTKNISLFTNYVEGNSPVTSTAFDGSALPNIESRNKEAGVKVDLFQRRAILTASYFDLTQANVLFTDPDHPGFQIAGPGQRSRGIDLNLTGTILPGWTMVASLTRAKSQYTEKAPGALVVARAPRDIYSIYSSYIAKLTPTLSGGVSVGLYGRSSSSADFLGTYYVPPARQVDVNGFLTFDGFSVNVGVRNLFNRLNYNITSALSYIPVDEPRNVRVTLSKRFF